MAYCGAWPAISAPISRFPCCRSRNPSNGFRRTSSCPRSCRRGPELPAVAHPAADRRSEIDGRPLSRRTAVRTGLCGVRPSAKLELDEDAKPTSRLMRFAEHLLASAVGAASSRLVMALLIEAQQPEPARRHETARRCIRRHPVQPRPPAISDRPRAARASACSTRTWS